MLRTTLISVLALLEVVTGHSDPKPWPYMLADSEKFYPQNSNSLAKRQAPGEEQQVLNGVMMRDGSVRKMSGNEGEKLLFWVSQGFSPISGIDDDAASGNDTTAGERFEAPCESTEEVRYEKNNRNLEDGGFARWFALGRRSGLVKRQDFTCPDGASSCDGIGRPRACCQNGFQCQKITDTGFGDVGCCKQGQSCSGGLDRCFEGYTKCDGGGCCRPGYYCTNGGCAPVGKPQVPFLSTRPTVATGLDICEQSYYPCPSSLSFGCCRIGRLCGIMNCPLNTGPGTPGIEYLTGIPNNGGGGGSGGGGSGGTITVAPPEPDAFTTDTENNLKPTDSVKQTGAAGGVITVSGGSCPTGYFSCGAEYNGGCCRTGRECGTTSCPLPSESGGGGGGSDTEQSCAPGYYGCPSSLNGGCCPSGYACALNNCPASSIIGPNGQIQTAATASAAPKSSPNSARPSKAPTMAFCAIVAGFLTGVLAVGALL